MKKIIAMLLALAMVVGWIAIPPTHAHAEEVTQEDNAAVVQPVAPPEVPIDPTVAPVEPTEAPIEPTVAPVEPTEGPVEPTEAPVEPTEAPIEPTVAPVEPTEGPVEPTEAPVEPTEAPIDPTVAPVEPTEAPVDPTGAPAEPTEPSEPEVDGEQCLVFELEESEMGQRYRVSGSNDEIIGKLIIPATHNGLPVTAIGYSALCDQHKMTSVVLPESITVIDQWAFANCPNLRSVNLPDGVIAIAEYAFAYSDLREIRIPDNISYLGAYAFAMCPLTGIWVSEDNPNYANDEKGVLFSKDMTLLRMVPSGLTGSYAIPDGVECIGSYAFSYARLSEVTFPDSVMEIGYGAFESSNLAEIVVGNGVTGIATDAFAYCENLTAVTIPNKVAHFGGNVFGYSPNVTVYCYIGSPAATYAAQNNVQISYLDAVKEVSIATMPEKLTYPLDGHLKLNGLSLDVTLEDGTEVTIFEGYTVGEYDFSTAGTKTITITLAGISVSFEVEVDDQLIEYPESDHPYADNCDITWKFTYPEDVDMLTVTFSEDTMLENGCDYIYIGDSEGNETSYGGRELAGKKLILPGRFFTIRLTSDGSATYYGFAITSIEALKKVDLGKVTFTPDANGDGYIVTDCDETAADILEIPAVYQGLPVVAIGDNAFQNCSGLKEITIPDSISAIGNSVFSGCNKLTDVYYGSSRKQWNAIQMGEDNEILSAVKLHFAYCEDAHIPGESVIVDEWGGGGCLDTRYQTVATYCLDCGIEIERKRVVLPPRGHTPGEAVIESEWMGSCTECGGYLEVIYCTECNETISRVTVQVEPTGHTEGETQLYEEPATCTSKGYREWLTLCANCDYVIKRVTEDIPATGHTPGETYVDRAEPTCCSNGYIWTIQHCADCNMQISGTYEVLPATDHIPGEVQQEIVNEGSCTSDRIYWNKVYCQNCWRTLSSEYVVEKATGHTPGEPVINNEWVAGCENVGRYYSVVYCTNENCGAEISNTLVVVPPLGHTEEIIPGYAATCTEYGLTDGKRCTTCGMTTQEQEWIDPLGHTPGDAVKENETDTSYDCVVYCAVCNTELSREYVESACSHANQQTEAVETVPASCTVAGYTVYNTVCLDCGEILSSDTDSVPALGHSYTKYVADGKGNLVAECDNGCGTTDSKIDASSNILANVTVAENGQVNLKLRNPALLKEVFMYYIADNAYEGQTGLVTWKSSMHKQLLAVTKAVNDADVNGADGYRTYGMTNLPQLTKTGTYVFRVRYYENNVERMLVQVIDVENINSDATVPAA
ncbi:MAG: leucine-rich repeat protein, partial [Alistipes sp.]|nr:leucine-rich repeat protein [Alistipes sp.]